MSRIAADVILEICHQADVEPGDPPGSTHGARPAVDPHIHLSTTAGGATSGHTWKNLQFMPVR